MIKSIYSNISRNGSTGSVFVGTELVSRIANVTLVRTGNIFGNQIVVEHVNGGTYTVKQLDRGFFVAEGPHYNGEVEGFADAIRLINSL